MNITGKTLTATEEIVLKDGLVDIQAWVDAAIQGRIDKCRKNMIRDWRPKLTADPDVETMPADDDKLIEMIVARDDYKTRVERDAEAGTP